MPRSADRLAPPGTFVRTASSLAALAASYFLGFAAAGILSIPLLGAWGIILAIAGVIVALPFLCIAALVLVIFQRSIAAHPLPWCIMAPPAVLFAWLAAEYGSNYRFRGFSFAEYMALQNVIERAALVFVTAGMASAAFYVTEARIRRRFIGGA